MGEERARILQMVNEGKITAEEGVGLLSALRNPEQSAPPNIDNDPRWFHIRVTDMETGRARVNVNLPLRLMKAAFKLGSRFCVDTEDLDWEELMAAIEEGASGRIVEVEDEEDGEKVEVFVE